MDAFQQPRGYTRPPVPPSPSDPYQLYHQPPPRAPVPPPTHPQAPTWYRNQFQYPHSPSPPPPWGPPPPPPPTPPQPHSSTAYPAHPLPPYYAHHPPHQQYNGDQFPLPPRPPFPQSQISQPYPLEWNNQNWGYHQSWDYQAQSNAEDWGAKAREWAAAKAASDNQLSQSQLVLSGRPEEQRHVHDQYPQSADSQQQPIAASSYQQFPDASSGVPGAGFQHQQSFPTTSAFYQQEVPSSYSSVAGKEENADYKEQMYTSMPLPSPISYAGQNSVPTSLPTTGGSISMEQPYAYSDHNAVPASSLSDQPLQFATGFNPDHDSNLQSSHAAQPNAWTPPLVSGVVYPPLPPSIPSGSQHDHSVAVAPPVSGHVAPPFVRFPASGLQPAIPAAGSSYGLSAGPSVHPAAAFPDETYGVSALSERPKKVSVPNWLKEEILKNKAALGKSSLENHRAETRSDEEDGKFKSYGDSNLADCKSVDSSKSTEEEEDDDEDYIEATRTAAINQEIKRILTEVLLKVTDELFDEIATKVLTEEDENVEDDYHTVPPDRKVTSMSTAASAHQASAKILVPVKAKESKTDDVSEKSSFSSPGVLLGLANYASDDDEDDGNADEENGGTQGSSFGNSNQNIHQCSSDKNLSDDEHNGQENKDSKAQAEQPSMLQMARENQNNTSALQRHGDSSHEHVSTSRELSEDGNEHVDGDKFIKYDPDDQHEDKMNHDGGVGKQIQSDGSSRANNEVEESPGRRDERLGKEKSDHRNGSKHKTREHDAKLVEKQLKDSDLRKRSTQADVKEDRKDVYWYKRSGYKEPSDRKRDRSQEEEQSKHKHASDSSREKRRRSPPIKGHLKPSKDNSVTHGDDSADELSDEFRRMRSRKRHSSPSPVRSRRRQVSRSPHSKHSQRRHSPYSSLETTRRRRSESRSSPRRHR